MQVRVAPPLDSASGGVIGEKHTLHEYCAWHPAYAADVKQGAGCWQSVYTANTGQGAGCQEAGFQSPNSVFAHLVNTIFSKSEH